MYAVKAAARISSNPIFLQLKRTYSTHSWRSIKEEYDQLSREGSSGFRLNFGDHEFKRADLEFYGSLDELFDRAKTRNGRSKESRSAISESESEEHFPDERDFEFTDNDDDGDVRCDSYEDHVPFNSDDDLLSEETNSFMRENHSTFGGKNQHNGTTYNYYDPQFTKFNHDEDYEYDSPSEYDPEMNLTSERLTLGLSSSGPLNLEDVKNAYRDCALKWHPDHHQGSSKVVAEENFKLCSAAYQTLCDKVARH